MRLRYAGACRICGVELPARSEAVYERSTKSVRCVSHDVQVPGAGSGTVADPRPAAINEVLGAEPIGGEVVDSGVAGASARREFEWRKAKREARVRTRHPKLGGLLLAISAEAQSTNAWDVGAVGEGKLGRGLDPIAGDTVRVLHDRRIPRSRANIDHLVVTANGVFVIDAKRYSGRPHLRVGGGILRPRVERLFVGSRDCTKLVDGVLKQVEVVRGLLDADLPVHGVLCFVEADWPLIGGSFMIRGVRVEWPKRLFARLQADGPVPAETISKTHRTLAQALRSA
jgi:hypothetical protein